MGLGTGQPGEVVEGEHVPIDPVFARGFLGPGLVPQFIGAVEQQRERDRTLTESGGDMVDVLHRLVGPVLGARREFGSDRMRHRDRERVVEELDSVAPRHALALIVSGRADDPAPVQFPGVLRRRADRLHAGVKGDVEGPNPVLLSHPLYLPSCRALIRLSWLIASAMSLPRARPCPLETPAPACTTIDPGLNSMTTPPPPLRPR